jgi:hypothetical protein
MPFYYGASTGRLRPRDIQDHPVTASWAIAPRGAVEIKVMLVYRCSQDGRSLVSFPIKCFSHIHEQVRGDNTDRGPIRILGRDCSDWQVVVGTVRAVLMSIRVRIEGIVIGELSVTLQGREF